MKTVEGSLADCTDDRLIRAIVDGDEAAFAELYRRYKTPLYNYLLRLVHEREVAEETLQDVFVAAWEGAVRFRGEAKVSTWLFRIAHHQAVDWLRKRRPALLEKVEWLVAEDCPEEEAFRRCQVDQLCAAIDELSADHRAVLELTFLRGLSYREVALVVGCPVGTVKSRISYAKRHLNGVLKRMELD